MIEPRLLWEPWRDPMREVLDCSRDHDPGLDAARRTWGEGPRRCRFKGAAIVTEDAIIPIDEDGLPSNVYNLQVAHTNFTIDEPFAAMVEAIEGVEALCVYKRYRMRVGFGRLFDEGVVKEAILDAAREHLG